MARACSSRSRRSAELPAGTNPTATDRQDAAIYFHAEPAQPPEAVAIPAPPSEPELRAQLLEAIAHQREVERAVQRSVAAAERAGHHRGECERRLAGFADVDNLIAASVLEALRCDAGRLSTELSEVHELLIADRAKATTEKAAADAAVSVLLGELGAAQAATGPAEQAVTAAEARVLTLDAQKLATQHMRLEAESRDHRVLAWLRQADRERPGHGDAGRYFGPAATTWDRRARARRRGGVAGGR